MLFVEHHIIHLEGRSTAALGGAGWSNVHRQMQADGYMVVNITFPFACLQLYWYWLIRITEKNKPRLVNSPCSINATGRTAERASRSQLCSTHGHHCCKYSPCVGGLNCLQMKNKFRHGPGESKKQPETTRTWNVVLLFWRGGARASGLI